MIKTEAVTVRQPKVIESYSDILANRSIYPSFTDLYDEFLSFKSADSSSMKARIWQRVLDKGLDKCVLDMSDLSGFIAALPKFKEQEVVGIVYD